MISTWQKSKQKMATHSENAGYSSNFTDPQFPGKVYVKQPQHMNQLSLHL